MKWQNDKSCIIKKIKDPDIFRIEDSNNIKLKKGDLGKIESLVLGKPLIVTGTMRNNTPIGTYSGAT